MPQEPFVKDKPHFTYSILYRDIFAFEESLQKAGIRFQTEENPLAGTYVKYYFINEDYERLDTIVKKMKLNTGADYEALKKTYKLYLVITIIVGILLYIVSLWD